MAGDGQQRPDVVPRAICSQFSLTEEFEKMLLVSEDGHVASVDDCHNQTCLRNAAKSIVATCRAAFTDPSGTIESALGDSRATRTMIEPALRSTCWPPADSSRE